MHCKLNSGMSSVRLLSLSWVLYLKINKVWSKWSKMTSNLYCNGSGWMFSIHTGYIQTSDAIYVQHANYMVSHVSWYPISATKTHAFKTEDRMAKNLEHSEHIKSDRNAVPQCNINKVKLQSTKLYRGTEWSPTWFPKTVWTDTRVYKHHVSYNQGTEKPASRASNNKKMVVSSLHSLEALHPWFHKTFWRSTLLT